jgi:flagellar protein FliS
MTYTMPRGAGRQKSAQSYANVGLETEVLSASPERLITLLFNGARAAIMKARLHMENGDIPGRGQTISKAIDIVGSGLKAAVNEEAGGQVAKSLITSYDLIIYNLLQANLHGDMSRLDTAERILTEIASAWKEITEPAAAGKLGPAASAHTELAAAG